MAAAFPEDEDSPEAREGTAAHWYVTETLAGRTASIGMVAPNGHPIDQEMIDCGQGIIEDVRDVVKTWPGYVPRIESRLYMSASIHALCWGTADVYFLNWERKRLYVWDYKYGHRPVDAWECWQLVLYTAGVFESEGVPPSEWLEWTIVLTIAQPRCFHPDGAAREWQITGLELVGHVAKLREAAALAVDPEAPMRTGEYCIDCPAVTHCPAALENASRYLDLSRTAQPFNLPPHALGLMLKLLVEGEKRIKAMRVGLEEEALRAVRTGQGVPFWHADYANGRERWILSAQEVAVMGDMLGIPLRKTDAVITPAQARKAGLDADLVKAMSDKPKGALILVPFDDKSVAKAFS